MTVEENINEHSIEFINTVIDCCGKMANIIQAVDIFNNIHIVIVNTMVNGCNNKQYDN